MLWTNNAIVLSARPLGEGKAIASLLSEDHGGYRGVIPGGNSGKRRHLLQPGTLVRATWRARMPEHLGVFTVELLRALDTSIIHHRLRLAILLAACSLLDASLPEREPNPALYAETLTLLAALAGSRELLAAYADWERRLVAALGFGGLPSTPTSNAAGHNGAGGIAAQDRERAMHSPEGQGQSPVRVDVVVQLRSTLRTLETHVFTSGRQGIPAARSRLASLIDADRHQASISAPSPRSGSSGAVNPHSYAHGGEGE